MNQESFSKWWERSEDHLERMRRLSRAIHITLQQPPSQRALQFRTKKSPSQLALIHSTPSLLVFGALTSVVQIWITMNQAIAILLYRPFLPQVEKDAEVDAAPKSLEWWIILLAPRGELSESYLRQFDEQYAIVCRRQGKRKANFWGVIQVFSAAWTRIEKYVTAHFGIKDLLDRFKLL